MFQCGIILIIILLLLFGIIVSYCVVVCLTWNPALCNTSCFSDRPLTQETESISVFVKWAGRSLKDTDVWDWEELLWAPDEPPHISPELVHESSNDYGIITDFIPLFEASSLGLRSFFAPLSSTRVTSD